MSPSIRPAEFVGETLSALQIRARHDVDVLLIRRGTGVDGQDESIMASAQTVIAAGDRLLLFGKIERLQPFRSL